MLKTRVALILVVLLHFYIVIVNCIAFLVLPIVTTWVLNIPFWYTILLITPIESVIIYLAFNRAPCPLTNLENRYRSQLNMPEVKGFISYYLVRQKWRTKQES
jgi:hypothetical protein